MITKNSDNIVFSVLKASVWIVPEPLELEHFVVQAFLRALAELEDGTESTVSRENELLIVDLVLTFGYLLHLLMWCPSHPALQASTKNASSAEVIEKQNSVEDCSLHQGSRSVSRRMSFHQFLFKPAHAAGMNRRDKDRLCAPEVFRDIVTEQIQRWHTLSSGRFRLSEEKLESLSFFLSARHMFFGCLVQISVVGI